MAMEKANNTHIYAVHVQLLVRRKGDRRYRKKIDFASFWLALICYMIGQ